MALNIKIEAFEGPFDLLFHLIEKNQIDIYDIPISKLTEQYLSYLEELNEKDLDIASEFLVMAATLLSIKSKMLLPSRQIQEAQVQLAAVDDDPRTELVNKLLEYKKFKEIADQLKEKEKEQMKFMKKLPEDLSNLIEVELPPLKVTFKELKACYEEVINRTKQKPKIVKITKEPVSLSQKVIEVYGRLKKLKTKVFFSRLCDDATAKMEVILTFLAVLELVKLNKIFATQKHLFGEIILSCREV